MFGVSGFIEKVSLVKFDNENEKRSRFYLQDLDNILTNNILAGI